MPNKPAKTFEDIAEIVLSNKLYTANQFEKDVKNVLSVGFKLNAEQVKYTYTMAFREGQTMGYLGVLEFADDLAKYAKLILKSQDK